MFLDYFALGLLIFAAVTLFGVVIAIHDIPDNIAKSRNYPRRDAIRVARWASLFAPHAIWPFFWIGAKAFGKRTAVQGIGS